MARELEVSAPAVTKWLRDGRVGRENLVEFCESYGIDLRWMLTGKGSMLERADSNLVLLSSMRLSDIRVSDDGSLRLVSPPNPEFLIPQAFQVTNDNEVLSVYVTDESMGSALPKGAYALIQRCDPDSALKVGSVVAVTIKGVDQLFLRRFEQPRFGETLFVPDNHRYPSINGEDARVFGVCTEIRTPLI
ncbi:hypothetical protein AQ621_16395 (plasmid) [Marinobacter sp. P4B1]|nr:hypothetical protein AQ621_16395 [Marinobacter sp. P4B1]